MLDFSNSSSLPGSSGSSSELGTPANTEQVKIPTVLVVDDNIDNLVLLTYILEQYNCEIVSETNGQAALKLIWKLQPDLVMLDIRLPGLSGLDIIQEIRSTAPTHSLPIIAITALASQEDREQILHVGCDQYISKPFMLEELNEILEHYLVAKVSEPLPST